MLIRQYKTMMSEIGLPELVKERSKRYDCTNLLNPEQIANMMRDVFRIHRQTEEFLYEVCFTTKMKPIGVFEISHGTVNASLVGVREIFQKALLCGAACIAIVHNHPSGDCRPSVEDCNVANRVKEGGELLGIELVDSIIIVDESYFSFRENK